MASFRNFPNLPYELRSEIWRLAIRPSAEGYSGMQCFSFLHNHLPPNDPRTRSKRLCSADPAQYHLYPTVFDTTIPGLNEEDKDEVNRSAYIWDAGLWTACWESRQIIMRHWEMKKWLKKRGTSFEHPGWEPEKDLCATGKAPALYSSGGQEDWQLMVRPYQDGFYFDVDNLREALSQPSDDVYFSIRDIMWKLPFSRGSCGCRLGRNIIIDFDPTWIKDMPRDGCIFFEDSPRGCIGKMLHQIALENYDCHIWLIDRSLHQPEDEDQDASNGAPRVFYNCDEEFVDVGMGGYEGFEFPWDRDPREESGLERTYKCNEKDLSTALAGEENGLAGWFVYMLAERGGIILSDMITERPFEEPPAERSDYFDIKEHLGILGYKKKRREV